MARDIKGDPKNLTEALYLLDRNKLKVRGARTRAEAVEKLRKEYGDDTGSTGSGADETNEADYSSWNKAQLNEEIDRRNADRDPDEQIQPSGTKNADLVTALEDDDAFMEDD